MPQCAFGFDQRVDHVGLIGLLGGVAAGVFSPWITLDWWVYSLIAIALVGIFPSRD